MSPLALLAFLAFGLVALVLPGLTLQRLARVPADPALVLPLGTAFTAGLYWLALAAGQHWIFPLGLVVSLLFLVLPGPRRARAQGPPLRGAVAPLVGLMTLLAVAQYRWNRIGPEGDFLLDPLVPFDSAFHVGLTHELALAYPPQLPGASGFPVGYHFGTDLVRAAALRWAGIDPWDSLTRLDVTLWGLALILALRGAAARLGAPPAAVALAPWTLFLTDFSFVFGASPQAHWWTDLLRGNLLLSLAYSNPIIPALGLTLGALLALDRHQAGEGRGYLALATVQALAVPFFKVFLGGHLLLGLASAFLLARGGARASLLALAAPCAIVSAALALGVGGQTVDVVAAPLDLVRVTRDTLGLAPLSGMALALWSVPWLLGSLGLRVAGLGEAMRALRGPAAASALGAIALSGWPLGLLLRVAAPEVLEGQRPVNDAAYLLEQSGPILWVFTAIVVVRFADRGARRILTAVAIAVLALPATAQFAVKKVTMPPARMPAPMVRAARALAAASRPGDVVLQRPGGRYPPAPVVLAGRRVTYERFTPYLTQFAPRAALERRHEAVYRFFRTHDRDEAVAIARELGAGFLALYGPDRVRFDTTGLLEAVHEETEARIYRFRLD